MRTREEQVDNLTDALDVFDGNHPEKSAIHGYKRHADAQNIAHQHIVEAEQRGYERARAECAADTRRIDTIEKLIAKTVSVEIVGHFNKPETSLNALCGVRISGETGILPNIRAAIDAAMEGGK